MNMHDIEPWLVLGILIVELVDFFRTRWEWKQEYEFDRSIIEKKQRKTKTTRKTTETPEGTVTEENTEIAEGRVE